MSLVSVLPEKRLPFEYTSASQIKTFRRAPFKWWLETIGGLRGPETPSQKRGKQIHSEIEDWHLHKTMPKDPCAVALLPRLPDKVEPIQVEFGFSLVLGDCVPIVGFIDLLEPEANRISDYKSTSSISKFGKQSAELLDDPQSVVYCAVGAQPRVLGPGGEVHGKKVNVCTKTWNGPVTFRHVYTQVGTTTGTDEVCCTFERESILLDKCDKIVQTVQQMMKAARSEPFEIGCNLDACDDYGGCPHKAICAKLGRAVYGEKLGGLFLPKGDKVTTQNNKVAELLAAAARKNQAAQSGTVTTTGAVESTVSSISPMTKALMEACVKKLGAAVGPLSVNALGGPGSQNALELLVSDGIVLKTNEGFVLSGPYVERAAEYINTLTDEQVQTGNFEHTDSIMNTVAHALLGARSAVNPPDGYPEGALEKGEAPQPKKRGRPSKADIAAREQAQTTTQNKVEPPQTLAPVAEQMADPKVYETVVLVDCTTNGAVSLDTLLNPLRVEFEKNAQTPHWVLWKDYSLTSSMVIAGELDKAIGSGQVNMPAYIELDRRSLGHNECLTVLRKYCRVIQSIG